MPKRISAVALILFVWPLASNFAQRSGTTSLVLRVGPESRLDPQLVVLNFRVSADGGSDVTTQAATVAALVRALPGQRIRVTAQLANLAGPDGLAGASAVRWSGSALSASAGARQAVCSSGVFGGAPVEDLVQGWQNSGILTCALKFELDRSGLPPGLYSGVVSLAVSTQ